MKTIPLLQSPALPAWLEATRRPWQAGYYAMYSDLLGGIVTDPLLMQVPVDDHLVHRGDGVFETLKCVGGRIYLGREHIARLMASSTKVGMTLSWSAEELTAIMRQTVAAGGHPDCLIRILVSRGPGSFGVNPYDCPKPGLYVIAHKLSPPFMEIHPGGAKVRSSTIPVKSGPFATVKSCNYLPNALMKKEAVDAGVDFTVTFDEQGFLAEGATENVGILTAGRELLLPETRRILAGTTMLRTLALARPLLADGTLSRAGHASISRRDLELAPEIFIFGTTPDVTAVIEFDGRTVGDGRPGPVWRKLSALLTADIASGVASL